MTAPPSPASAELPQREREASPRANLPLALGRILDGAQRDLLPQRHAEVAMELPGPLDGARDPVGLVHLPVADRADLLVGGEEVVHEPEPLVAELGASSLDGLGLHRFSCTREK